MKPAMFAVGEARDEIYVEAEPSIVLVSVSELGHGRAAAAMKPHEARQVAYALLNAADAAQWPTRATATEGAVGP